LFSRHRQPADQNRKSDMNATMPGTTTKTTGEGGSPAFDRLTKLYERLGLESEQADAAASADLACGWDFDEFPG
jgi:hypothetical protein